MNTAFCSMFYTLKVKRKRILNTKRFFNFLKPLNLIDQINYFKRNYMDYEQIQKENSYNKKIYTIFED
ncbi:MAG: hypothetical protein EA362_04135 [Saprospirales bacterium]|nr:MAG: hypothetical protein EA362_04135 [Saprospirales bacterium]